MGESTTGGSAADESAPDPSRPAGRSPDGGPPARPWWRRGSVWFVIIVVEVIAVTAISFAFARPPGEVSLAGADVARLCADVARLRAATVQQRPLTIETAAGGFQAEADAYRQLVDAAPTAVRPDLERLAGLSEELAETARTLAAQDPPGGAATALAARQGELAGRARAASERVRAAIRQACGIDIEADPTLPEQDPAPGAPAPPTTAPLVTTPGTEPVTAPSTG